VIEKLKQLLIKDEGEVNHVYRDSEGWLTIGVGHLVDERKGGKISHAAAMFILDEDIAEKLGQCERAFDWFDELSENRKIVIVSMVFNMGLSNFKEFKRTIVYIENKEYDEASIEMLDSTWSNQVGSRAAELSNLMRVG